MPNPKKMPASEREEYWRRVASLEQERKARFQDDLVNRHDGMQGLYDMFAARKKARAEAEEKARMEAEKKARDEAEKKAREEEDEEIARAVATAEAYLDALIKDTMAQEALHKAREKAEKRDPKERKKIAITVAAAEAQLNALIEETMQQEGMFSVRDHKKRMAKRVIVTNIAADADLEDIWDAFYGFQDSISAIRILDERKPISRTRTAYIDFNTQDAALVAVCSHKPAIFGLSFKTSLAIYDGVEWAKCIH